ncbi:T-cell leukemia translocation-altered gene protein homolog isoform X1 [Cyclopterus lumpus]|uniref:T-cell leukemia translocation-altered gene protein homolog isoform X1 n=1 Tax=Cyclopterus lumpus TaxID=8103 RepID=UPI0014874E4E|nr:T-cell leukemia translocation-altered gene protein homolog isoform X1 [Cyclopterus lumpus]
MEEPWDFEFFSRIADSCLSFLSEFVDDWLANDMRVSIFKILLGWLILSLVAIHFAWKIYGNTVNDMYYRQGKTKQEMPQRLIEINRTMALDFGLYPNESWTPVRDSKRTFLKLADNEASSVRSWMHFLETA